MKNWEKFVFWLFQEFQSTDDLRRILRELILRRDVNCAPLTPTHLEKQQNACKWSSLSSESRWEPSLCLKEKNW